MQLTSEKEETENKENLLASIANVDVQAAGRVLRKHNGNMDKAAEALLAGDLGIEVELTSWDTQRRNTPDPMHTDGLNTDTLAPPVNAALPSSGVIDLTVDDDDMTRAIELSIQETSQTLPQFGPSERAPHPEWQIVRADAPVSSNATQEDHTLNEAIQASLQDFKEDIDMTPFMESVREAGRPIALRPDTPALAYAALVIQALYYIPQVRLSVSNLRLPAVEDHTPLSDPHRAMWNLIELFTNMDLAQLAAIVDNAVIPSLEINALAVHRSLADASNEVVKNISTLVERHLEAQAGADEEPEFLFSFTHGHVIHRHGHEPDLEESRDPGTVVTVDVGGGNSYNDLISCISANLNKYTNTASHHDVIIRPSEVVGFALKRPHGISGVKISPDPFVYPKTLFMDRFLYDNYDLVHEKRRSEREIKKEIDELKALKEKLTRSEDRDSLQSLRSTIYYYENVADAGDDPVRKRMLGRVADHLNDILLMITGKIEDIDHKVAGLQSEIAEIYECPELQKIQYDLRAVLFHTGLPGRKQIYSYVQDIEGTWWKTVDHEVTEVSEETVLNDPTGLHLGAGPYMLFYSRHMSEEHLREPLIWPSIFSEAVEENNKKFLALMHPELEIFSSSRSSPDPIPPPPVVRELPIPQEKRSIHRENSRS